MKPTRFLRRAAAGGLTLTALVLAGCGGSGPKLYGVYGTVKYKGEPIKSGMISFRADDGASAGAQITDGKYDIPAAAGLPVGKYRVAVTYPDPKLSAPQPDEPPGPAAERREMLPARFNDQTELTAEIKSESNDVSFDLK